MTCQRRMRTTGLLRASRAYEGFLPPAAQSGLFNTFMGEFNFSDLPESDLMRSIRLFGEKVIPALRAYEPF
jgi:hypothetical protein